PGPAVPGDAAARRRVLRLPDGRRRRRHVGGVRAVDPRRARRVLPVRAPPFAAGGRKSGKGVAMNRTDGAGPAGTMRVLAGYSPDERGDDALALAALVARAADAELTVAHVYPAAWPAHGPGRVDAEWVAYLREQADETLARAVERLAGMPGPGTAVTARAHASRGSGRGLAEVAEDAGAGLVVIGSAPRGR